MNAARPLSASTPSSAVDGAEFVRIVRASLDAVLEAAEVGPTLAAAGWDARADAPVDQRIGPREWLETRLLPTVVERAGLLAAERLRDELHARLADASGPAAVPASGARPAVRTDEVATRSGIRARRRSGAVPTYAPPAIPGTTIVWTDRPEELAALRSHAPVMVVHDVDQLVATLSTLGSSAGLVVLDRRGRPAAELRALRADQLEGRRVLLWGVKVLGTPELDRILCDTERCIACADEADPADVASLCLAVLGARGD